MKNCHKVVCQRLIKCPSCDCHIVVDEKGQKEFCIKDER